MNSCELVSLVTAVSCGISKCVPPDDLPEVAAIFGQIASTLATITVNDATNKRRSAFPEIITPDTVIVDPSI